MAKSKIIRDILINSNVLLKNLPKAWLYHCTQNVLIQSFYTKGKVIYENVIDKQSF